MSKLELRIQANGQPLHFPVTQVINGGYSGRDQTHVQAHIDEMKVLNLPSPQTTPTIYFLSRDRVTTEHTIEVQNKQSSGEVEYVLIWQGGQIYVTVGSDQTDRQLEAFDIPASKQLYPNLLAPEVWLLDEVRGHWDSLILICQVEKDGCRSLYQQAPLADLLPFSNWLDRLPQVSPPSDGTIFFAGTVPTVGGELVYGDAYEIALQDPVRDRVISHSYRVEYLPEAVQ